MKKFTIHCDFGGQMSPFSIYIGKPQKGHHPLHFQNDWLSKTRGGVIPPDIMEAVTSLENLAEQNNVLLEDLCVYALGTEKEQEELDAMSEQEEVNSMSEKEELDDLEEEIMEYEGGRSTESE